MSHKNSFKTKYFNKKHFLGLIISALLMITYVSLKDQNLTFITKASLNENVSSELYLPNLFGFQNIEQISATGQNSTQTRVVYNPVTKNVYVTWIDLYQSFSPNAISTIYYALGNENTQWSSNVHLVTSINDTITNGFVPSADANETVHIIYNRFKTDNYDLNETVIVEETLIEEEKSVVFNSGNSTCPVSLTDEVGIVHLVWIDTTDNPNGDLYYTFYNASNGSWETPFVRVTIGAEVVTTIQPALTIDENRTLHLIWVDKRATDQELYYSYLDVGGSWSIEAKITTLPYNPVNPKVAYDKEMKNLHLIFKDDGASQDLYYIYGDIKAGAGDWSTHISLSNNLPNYGNYDICSDIHGNLLIVFERSDGIRNNIYLLHKKTNTSSWSPLELISTLAIPAYNPSITFGELGNIYITFTQAVDGITEVFIKYGILDSDGDGLSDAEEIEIYGTDPHNSDTDGDGLSDGDEILLYFTDPTNPDTDEDGMPDGFEIMYHFNPNDNSDANLDFDMDGLTNVEEYLANTNPLIEDTDADYLSDGDEVKIFFTDPNNPDTDGDKLLDGYEARFGLNPLEPDDISLDLDGDGLSTEFESIIWTDPTNPDTDGDGVSDGVEVAYGTDPLDPNDFPIFETPKNYRNLIIGILLGVGIGIAFLIVAIFVAHQFKPSESSKRKELQRSEKKYYDEQVAKGKKMAFEEQEKATLSKKQFEDTSKPETSIPLKYEKTTRAEPIISDDDPLIVKKRDIMKKAIIAIHNYESQLSDILKKQMTPHTISTITREALTEFAADSQSLYSEAQAIWTSTILPIIKGYEQLFHSETLEAEKILNNCDKISNKILDILVNREMEIVEEDSKREEVRNLAQKAIQEKEEELNDSD